MEIIKENKANKVQSKDCCEEENTKGIPKKGKVHRNNEGHENDEEGEHQPAGREVPAWKSHWLLLLSLVILFVMLILQFGFKYVPAFPIDLITFSLAYLLAGYSVLGMALRKVKRFDFFNEFFLMSVATIGAFTIGSYSEGVAVMVFYSIGEFVEN